MCRVNCSILDFGPSGANFSLQDSLRTQFAISNKKIKKLSPKINVKKIKTRVFFHIKNRRVRIAFLSS